MVSIKHGGLWQGDQVGSPCLKCVNNSQQFEVIDLIVLLSSYQSLRQVSAWVGYTRIILLQEDGSSS